MSRLRSFFGISLVLLVTGCATADSVDDYEPDDGLGDTARDGSAGDAQDDAKGDATADANGPDGSSDCKDIVCDTPPAKDCADADTARIYAAAGTCTDGVCKYSSTTVPCPFGCTAGACDENPCEGVSCNGPPANECVDATTLKAYAPSGTCGKEGCQYTSELLPCAHGCSQGKCNDDPCAGVSCVTPPANKCDGASYLLTYQPAGTCDSKGDCVYVEERKSCKHGCANGVCNADPCLGVTCETPWASYCQDDKLVVYESPGTCSGGTCTYTKREPLEHCTYGCDEIAGKCKKNPCLGVACTTPPADYCIGTTKLHRFIPDGTCSTADGKCSYGFEDIECPCEDGVCKDCLTDGDCEDGKFCNDNSCTPCRVDEHCGESCSDCTEFGAVCNKAAGSCVECTSNGHCGQGSQCVGNQCSPCANDEACGPSCEPCGATAPYCLGSGMSGRCVECLDDGDCKNGGTCDTTTKTCGVGPLCQAALDSAATLLANSSGWKHAKMDGVGTGWNWDFWQYGKATSGPGACRPESTNCWATNLTGNYINCQRADLRTPSMNLSACADKDIKLVFWHWFDFWTAKYPTSNGPIRYDGGLVELSGNGGTTWVAADVTYPGTTNINPNMGSSYACTSGNNFYVHNKPGYVGKSGGWERVEVTIPAALRTSQLMVRFAYASGVSFATTSQTPNASRAAPGWYLDGVSVAAP